jgi:hypothetical protein
MSKIYNPSLAYNFSEVFLIVVNLIKIFIKIFLYIIVIIGLMALINIGTHLLVVCNKRFA